jgi:hypothetical protein
MKREKGSRSSRLLQRALMKADNAMGVLLNKSKWRSEVWRTWGHAGSYKGQQCHEEDHAESGESQALHCAPQIRGSLLLVLGEHLAGGHRRA